MKVSLPALGAAIVALFVCYWGMTLGWSIDEIAYSFTRLRAENQDVIGVEDHLRDNLVVYPMGVMAGIGLPAFALALWGGGLLFRGHLFSLTEGLTPARLMVAFVFAYLATEAGLRWYMDTAFVRRVNVFMPAVALLAAYTLARYRVRPWLTALVIAWSVGLGVVGQSNHWNDPRLRMRDYMNAELQRPLRVGISAGINMKDFHHWRYYMREQWDYFVINEAWYRRFGKSMTTPFGWPVCDGGIYHNTRVGQCHDLQAMLGGTHPGVRLHRAFRTLDVFPERLLYHHFFGYYETFIGDVLIFKRLLPAANERTTS